MKVITKDWGNGIHCWEAYIEWKGNKVWPINGYGETKEEAIQNLANELQEFISHARKNILNR